MSFTKINFGSAAAENEKSYYPELLISGFLDAYGYIDQILYGPKFLILGPKGSGKSAIGSRLELMSKSSKNLKIRVYDLDTFPFNNFNGILPGREAPETRLPDHWEFLFLIALIDSFSRDPTSESTRGVGLKKMVSILQSLGMIRGKTLTEIVKKSTKTDYKLCLPKFFEVSHSIEKATELDEKFLFNNLKEVCYSVESNAQHIIVIDGLDHIITNREGQNIALSALMLSADRINKCMRDNNVNAKIVILCRNDLFDKLKGTDNNKIRQDAGIILDWYQDPKNVLSTNLIKLINLRAKVSLKSNRDIDVFTEYFPKKLNGLGADDSPAKLILEHTRHRPRDIIMLLSYIQHDTHDYRASQDSILTGIRNYSNKYFIQEIKDELIGSITEDERDKIFKMLSQMKDWRFTIDEIDMLQKSDPTYKDIHINDVLKALFECGAIGMMHKGGGTRYILKYRNPDVTLNINEVMFIHRGLQRALGFR